MKSQGYFFWFLILIISGKTTLQSQDYLLPVSGQTIYNTCSGTIFDDGGVEMNYSDFADGMVTLVPETPDSRIQLVFDYFDVIAPGDTMHIFNGDNKYKPIVGKYTQLPEPVYSTDVSGALTLTFTTDSAGNGPGFSASITCLSDTSSSELQIDDVRLQAPYANPGSNIGISSNILNNGDLVAKDITMGCYLSVDSLLDATDTLLYTSLIEYLIPGFVNDIYVIANIPADTDSGKLHVIIKIDNDDLIPEKNENDNILSASVRIQNNVQDLAITNAVISEYQQITSGSPMSLYARINNPGQVIIDTFNTGFYLSVDTLLDATDTLLRSEGKYDLYPGGNIYIALSVNLPEYLTIGTYYLIAYTDYMNDIEEIDETNNIKVLPFSVIPRYAELYMSDVQVTSGFLYKNISSKLTCKLISAGNYNIEDVYMGFYLSEDVLLDSSDMLIYTAHVEDVQYGYAKYAYVDLVFENPDDIENGFYYLIVESDSPDSIVEENEDNNMMYLGVLVTGYFTDIAISSIEAVPAMLANYETFTIRGEYANLSPVKIDDFYTYFYLSQDTLFNLSNDSLSGQPADIYLGYQHLYNVYPNSTRSGSATLSLSDSVPYGEYHVIGVADAEKKLYEEDTVNNIIFIPVFVGEAKSDLEMVNMDLPLKTLQSAQSINISAGIKNNGNQSAYSVNVDCFISNDSIYHSGDNHLQSVSLNSLYPGIQNDLTVSITIPSNQPDGDYYLLMTADTYNSINELNENNNIRHVKISIDNSFKDYSHPELSITGCYLGYSNVTPGDIVYFKGTAVNMGSAASDIKIAYYLSADTILDIEDFNHRLYETSFYSMNQGYVNSFSHSFVIPQTYQLGDYFLIAKIDDYNAVFEADENNNIAVLPVRLTTPNIDLLIENIYFNTSIILQGESKQISFYILNEGSSVSPSSQVAFFLSPDTSTHADEILLGTSAISSVNPGSSTYVSFNIQITDSITAGMYYLQIKIDNQNSITETNEENNTWFAILGVMKPDVDFRTNDILITSPAIMPGNSIDIRYKFYNDGLTSFNNIAVGYFLSTDTFFDINTDELIGYENITSIQSKNYRTIYDYVHIPVNTGLGQYRLFLVSDYQDLIPERLENNNVSFTDFIIYPPFVDLYLDNLLIDKNNVTQDEEFNIYCYVKNRGNTTAPVSYTGYYLSVDSILDAGDTLLKVASVSSLYSGDNRWVYYSFKLSGNLDPGNYCVLICADYNGVIEESDETNNLISGTITLLQSDVDIEIENISVTSGNLFSGTNMTIDYAVKNNGTTECPQSETRFYLSQDTVLNPLEDSYIGYSSNYTMSPGGSYPRNANVFIPGSLETGTYYLIAAADMLNAIEESNESNNQIRMVINLTESFIDLYITDATVPNNMYNPGDYTMLSFYLRNSGNKQSSSGYIYYYLSNDSVYDNEDIIITNSYYSYLNAGGSRYYDVGVWIPYQPVNDSCFILIIADYNNNTIENNENNNIRALPISIQTIWFRDLRAGWDSQEKFEYYYGDSVRCTFYFTMSGIDTLSSFYTAFYMSSDDHVDPDDYLISEIKNTIPPDDSILALDIQFKIPDVLEPGYYRVLCKIDSRDDISEVNEENNVQGIGISLVNTTDLRSGWETHEGYEYNPGDSIDCTFYFPYTGRDSIAPFYTGFYLSTDEHLDPTDYLIIMNESSGSFTDNIISMNVQLILPDTLEPGVYNIIGIIDVWNNITELDEENNIHSFEIEVSKNFVNVTSVFTGSTILYPNPATDHICISNEKGYGYMKILNSSGMLVMNLNIQKNLNIIDISGLMPGIYTIILNDNELTTRLKFVKIKE